MKVPILIVGDGDVPTGFARVLENIFTRLQDVYEIHHLAVSYDGDPHELPWHLYPASIGGDAFGIARLPVLVRLLRPRLVFLLSDIWNIAAYLRSVHHEDRNFGIVAYCPVETGPVDPRTVKELWGVDRFVVYTNYARRQMESALAQLRADTPDFEFPPIDVIEHGVDTDTFYPLGPKREAKRLLFGDTPSLVDSFIVLNANRNQPRKRIDVTIRGFALFAREKPPNVKLYLHMGIEDKGWDVVRLSRREGIEERLILTTRTNGSPAVSDEELNVIYNACDIGINTSATEGWGLVSFEHAATRSAQIVPGFGACAELWADAAELLDAEYSWIAPLSLLEEKLITPAEVAVKLERLYGDLRREALAEAAYARATNRAYCWDEIAARWQTLFDQVLALYPRTPGSRSA